MRPQFTRALFAQMSVVHRGVYEWSTDPAELTSFGFPATATRGLASRVDALLWMRITPSNA